MRCLIAILVLIVFSLAKVHAASSFRVIFYPDYMQVDIPEGHEQVNAVFIENKMIGHLRSKIINEKGEILGQVSLRKGDFAEIHHSFSKTERVQVVPLVPSLQEAVLQLGMADYEIPAKR